MTESWCPVPAPVPDAWPGACVFKDCPLCLTLPEPGSLPPTPPRLGHCFCTWWGRKCGWEGRPRQDVAGTTAQKEHVQEPRTWVPVCVGGDLVGGRPEQTLTACVTTAPLGSALPQTCELPSLCALWFCAPGLRLPAGVAA